MGLRELLVTLEDGAERERASVLDEARAGASRIRRERGSERERRRADFLRGVEREEVDASGKALSRARADARRSVLDARLRLLERVRAALERRIAEAGEDSRYLAVVERDLRDALGRLGRRDVVVRAGDDVARALSAALEELGDSGSIESDPSLTGGFVAASADGTVEIDATLEERLTHVWPGLAIEVVRSAEA